MTRNRIEIARYTPDMKHIWNDLVESSKNGTFLFNRDYMDYHSDRFNDNSYIFFRKEKPYCLFPACRESRILSSHAGLTYGGLVMAPECTAEGILEVFSLLQRTAENEGYEEIIYRPVPYIYHQMPSDEDLYALFRNNSVLTERKVSSAINLDRRLKIKRDRAAALHRSYAGELLVRETEDYETFWKILEENLWLKYRVRPVHSMDEIKSLANRFPENIRLLGSYKAGRMEAGVVCYNSVTTVHTQYISATPEGKKCGAVDAIICRLIDDLAESASKIYLDFGTSNENGGKRLNESLIYQKEGFGARAVCYDTWRIPLHPRRG